MINCLLDCPSTVNSVLKSRKAPTLKFNLFPNLSSDRLRSPVFLLMAMAAIMQISFAAWTILTNNFAVEELGFTGREIGIQQSIREIPGFLSFAAVFFLVLMREQVLAFVSLLVLGAGAAITGFFPSYYGFLLTTFISSMGFHYFETMNQSLALQWLPKKTAPATMGKILAVGSFAQLITFAFVFAMWKLVDIGYTSIFLITGGATMLGVVWMYFHFPMFREGVAQRKTLVVRKRYWLYYALTFMGGARRQIFMVFAAFMMVERFGFQVHEIAVLFFINSALNMYFAPKIGKWIMRYGERRTLTVEYIGLVLIFTAYAFVPNVWFAIALYIIDHAFFAMAIAMKTYFQKIADPADIAPTAGVAFTINHIAAVFIPVIFGLIWLWSPAAVFLAGAAMAAISIGLAQMVPFTPEDGIEFRWLETAGSRGNTK